MALSILDFAVLPGIGVFIVLSFLSVFSAPFLAAASAASFPVVPMWAFTQAIVQPFVLYFRFSSASNVLSAIVDLKSILSSALSAACESVIIFTYLGFIVSWFSFMYLQAWNIASSSAWYTVAWSCILKLCACICLL